VDFSICRNKQGKADLVLCIRICTDHMQTLFDAVVPCVPRTQSSVPRTQSEFDQFVQEYGLFSLTYTVNDTNEDGSFELKSVTFDHLAWVTRYGSLKRPARDIRIIDKMNKFRHMLNKFRGLNI